VIIIRVSSEEYSYLRY